MKELYNTVKKAIILILVLWISFTFFLGVKMAPNDDMKPKINAGDILLYYRVDKDVTAEDVIMIRKNKTDYIGRVIAVSGDTVDITDAGRLIVNGNTVSEGDIYFKTTPRYEGFVEYPITMKNGECFVLSDKREGGEDSRYYGPVKHDEIRGTIIGQFRKNGI